MAGRHADEALLLVAHGSARFPDAGRTVQVHAQALQPFFAEVAVGLLNGRPPAAEALASLRAPVVTIVPFFMEAGWFTQVAVPRALGLAGPLTEREGRTLRYVAPLGTHPDMAGVIEARVRRIAGAVSAVVAVGHGSARAPGRFTALHGHVARLARAGRFDSIEAAFLEEPPFAADAMARRRDGSLAVVGFFAGEGGHVREDLPELIGAECAMREQPLIDCGTIAEEPDIARIILELIGGA